MSGERTANIWLLTDRRYLLQRMPLALVDWLDAAGHPSRLVVADEHALPAELAPGSPSPIGPWSGLEPGDVVVTRSRHPYALALLQAAEALGALAVDSSAAVLGVRDKVRCAVVLSRAGIPAPQTFVARCPADLEGIPASLYPLILKPVFGDNARGLHVVTQPADLDAVAWTDDLVLAQRYLDAGGVDLKIYVAGDSIWAVRRPSPLTEARDVPVRARVTPALRAFAETCRSEFGLRLLGLDVLELPSGPVVVDVNEFPNYTGVDEAPAVIGRELIATATRLQHSDAERLLART